MLIKVPAAVWKGAGLLLTGLLTPTAFPYLEDAWHKPAATEHSRENTAAAPIREISQSPTRVRTKGSGPTPEAAFQSALDEALRQATANEVSAADWQQHGRDYLAALRQNGTGVLRGWREVSSGSERRLTGRVFQSEVEIEVDVKVMRERLRSAGQFARR